MLVKESIQFGPPEENGKSSEGGDAEDFGSKEGDNHENGQTREEDSLHNVVRRSAVLAKNVLTGSFNAASLPFMEDQPDGGDRRQSDSPDNPKDPDDAPQSPQRKDDTRFLFDVPSAIFAKDGDSEGADEQQPNGQGAEGEKQQPAPTPVRPKPNGKNPQK